jgi:hypothetical protein
MLTGEGIIFSSIFFQKAIPGIHSLFSRYFRFHLVQKFLYSLSYYQIHVNVVLFKTMSGYVSIFASVVLRKGAVAAGNPLSV